MKQNDYLTGRKSLDQICTVPDKIISVYSLEKHVWADDHSYEARKNRIPELKTIEELQIEPVRPFLTDIFRQMAAPYYPDRKDASIGQGYWIQAEFGSGKSHLLCFLSALALGSKKAWDIVKKKEDASGRGKRESLYRFWEDGFENKCINSKGLFVVVKTLVGSGSGTVGYDEKGKRFSEYLLDAVKEQLFIETGKNVSLYPVEILADRFLNKDISLYRKELAKFLRDPKYFDDDEYEDINDFIETIQQDKSPEYKRSCGNKLWRFYTEHLEIQPQVVAETEDVLKHLVEAIMLEGYSGVLFVLDEVSLFMKNRDEAQRNDDEKSLVVLSNRLAKVHNLPVWTVCAAQQAIESKMGAKNIIADDRLKLVKLLEEDKDYYDIVLARVREIKDHVAVGNYYQFYKRGFTWPNSIGEDEFRHFFPFHKPAIEVLRAITYELTTARSAIHFMHQTLKHQIKQKGTDLIRLWELFDEAVRYEEDPSGVHAGLVAIKTKKEVEYRAYESCKRQIDGLTKGYLKVHRDKSVKVIQTLFLYHVAKTRQQGLSAEEIANSVLLERDHNSTPEENIQHFETLSDNLKNELRQVVSDFDEDKKSRYRFDPVFTGVDPREEFRKARDEAEASEVMQKEAWEHLLLLGEWAVRTRQMTIDLSCGVKSVFTELGQYRASGRHDEKVIDLTWKGRHINGIANLKDLSKVISNKEALPPLDTDQTEHDFAFYIARGHIPVQDILKLLEQRRDSRVIIWSPDDLKVDERDLLIDFAAYRKLLTDWHGKDTEDGVGVINWLYNTMQKELAKIANIVRNSYGRGRIDALNNTNMSFNIAGELNTIITPIVDRVLTATYESQDIEFEPPIIFRKEEAIKLINGIIKDGYIPKGAKPNQNISAAQNFGYNLKIMKKNAERELDVSDNRFVSDIWDFIDDKLVNDGQSIKMETLYKNFMGIGGPKDYGLTKRMVQIFILCLVRQGHIRLTLSSKSGLTDNHIDYSNMSAIDFSAKVVDSIIEIQKVVKPENWEVLRPYAEKILNMELISTNDDKYISEYRAKLRQHFESEKENSQRILERAQSLFNELKTNNPYEDEINQVVKLYSCDISNEQDINIVLYALKEVMGYNAYDTKQVSDNELDDLANRFENYKRIIELLEYEYDLKVGYNYCRALENDSGLPDNIHKEKELVSEKLNNLHDYIDSPVRLRTELVGQKPPAFGNHGTIYSLVKTNMSAYITLHDTVLNRVDSCRVKINELLKGSDLKTLESLEEITALQPSITNNVIEGFTMVVKTLFSCPNQSHASLEEGLLKSPHHMCGLTFSNAGSYIEKAEEASSNASKQLKQIIKAKMEVFFNPAVRERLEQGRNEIIIDKLLRCQDADELWAYMAVQVAENRDIIETVNKYLKRIIVKEVKMANFKPTTRVIQAEQIQDIAEEFKQYLEEQIAVLGKDEDEDSLPMLQLE